MISNLLIKSMVAVFIAFFLLNTASFAENSNSQAVSIPDMTTITASVRKAPPSWAVMERHLMDTIEQAAPIYINQFTYRGGMLRQNGKIDDDYECFMNWPIFYALGGDEKILGWGLEEYNAITRQWTYKPNIHAPVDKEFVKQYDSLHLTEGYVCFQNFGLADPVIPENVDRARRFAGFYLGDDPHVFNYDPKYKVVRSIETGTDGAVDYCDGTYWLNMGFATLYPVVKELEWNWSEKPNRKKEIQKLYDEIVTRTDTPLNLTLTGLMTNAYLYTGDEKYKKWVLDYVDAWMERIKMNNGILPDNIGRTGKIGEYRKGQWWGGFFGWTSRYSLVGIFRGLITASECAHLLSGDPKYIDLIRSQVKVLLDNSITRDGTLLIPYKYGTQGWYDYRPFHPYVLSHIWHGSFEPDDWKLIETFRKGTKAGPWDPPATHSPDRPKPGEELWQPDGSVLDWNTLYNDHRDGQHVLNEPAYLNYLSGVYPDWPDRILKTEYEHVCLTLERMRSGNYVHEWESQSLLEQNPVMINGLRQMTMGGPPIAFNGGLVMAQLRYFDKDRARPGLPPDVAALIEKVDAKGVMVHLVNVSAFETRTVIVQAGAYGEHQVTDVKFKEQANDTNGKPVISEKGIPVNKKFFAVELPPSSAIELEIGIKRFVNQPSLAFPWHTALYQK